LKSKNPVYLGLGSNIGDRKKIIETAVSEISGLKDTKVLKRSSLYKTEPWGIKNQEFFLNSVIEIETSLNPSELLDKLKKIESALGRKTRQKWTEREIDIDILFFDNLKITDKDVNIPHPEIQNRNFVLVPFCEINPGFIHPVLKKSVKDLLNDSKDNSAVIIFKE
jgi:2-amino-4-hydroxy-6-hydroxymethyldihydropteridine diphosphokinase